MKDQRWQRQRAIMICQNIYINNVKTYASKKSKTKGYPNMSKHMHQRYQTQGYPKMSQNMNK